MVFFDPNKNYTSPGSPVSEHPADAAYELEELNRHYYKNMTDPENRVMETAHDLEARRPVEQERLTVYQYFTGGQITGPHFVEPTAKLIDMAREAAEKSADDLRQAIENEEVRRNNRNS